MAKYKAVIPFYSESLKKSVSMGDIVESELTLDEIVNKYGEGLVEEVKRVVKKKEVE